MEGFLHCVFVCIPGYVYCIRTYIHIILCTCVLYVGIQKKDKFATACMSGHTFLKPQV